MTGSLDLRIEGRIATIEISNPSKRNAMSADMWRALPSLLDDLTGDSGVCGLVLTGAGNTFCAGADIANLREMGADTGAANLAVAAEEALAVFPKPTIARIEGDCIGGGCQLAFACDLRIAAITARFGVTPARLGIVYPMSSTRRLVQLGGVSAAKYLLLTASLISAEQAKAMHLVHEVTAELDVRLAELTAILSGRSLLTQSAAKDIIAMISAGAVDESKVEGWMREVRDSGEAAEGAAAFLERRPPEFPWRLS